MSKKNLARTAIEGGRYGRNKWERRYSNRIERAAERNYLSKVEHNVEHFDDYDIKPRTPVYKEFKDKLNPMYRWLHSQVGRKWDDVKSDVFQTFDTRTTAGRHITYDHLLRSVEEVPDLRYRGYRGPYTWEEWTTSSWSENEFYVNDEGILCVKIYISRKQKLPKFDTQAIANWLHGRVVGKVGNKLFWFVPAGKSADHTWMCQWKTTYMWQGGGLRYLYLYHEPIYNTDKTQVIGHKSYWRDAWSPGAFRQDRKLNEKELKFWNTIPEFYQTKVLERSPTYPNPPKRDYYSGYGYPYSY
jgi:hypothetical protein